MRVVEGNLNADGIKLVLVASRFNDFVVSKLIDGAVDAFKRLGGSEENLTLIRVSGAFEIPVVVDRVLSEMEDTDAVICLGAVIKGATPHYELIAVQVSRSMTNLSLQYRKPVVDGVIVADTIEQAVERAGTKMGNKGYQAVMTAVETVSVLKQI